jgi:hypothetical protein
VRFTLVLLLFISKFLYADDASSQNSPDSTTIGANEILSKKIATNLNPPQQQIETKDTQPNNKISAASIVAAKVADNTTIKESGCGINLSSSSGSTSSLSASYQLSQGECIKLTQLKHTSDTSSKTNVSKSISAQAARSYIADNRSQKSNNSNIPVITPNQ